MVAAGMVAAGMAAGMMAAASPAQAASGPHYTWGQNTGTVYFNMKETAQLTYAGGVVAARAFTAEPYRRIIADHAAEIMVKAGAANTVGLCIKIKSTGLVGTYGGRDGDGYCL
jgi:hypothetical protein